MLSRWRSSSPLHVIVASASDQNPPCCWRVPRTCRLIALNTDLPYFAAVASVYRGLALSRLGSTDQGLALVSEGLAAYRATGALVSVPRFLLLLADCYRNAGEPREGLKYLDEAACLIEATQMRAAEADMYRRRGELLLVVGDRAAAEASFLQAIDVARRQKAKLLELQAASGSPGSGATRASARKPVICSVRSTIGSPKVSTRRT